MRIDWIITGLAQGVIACGMSTVAMLITWALFERTQRWDGEVDG